MSKLDQILKDFSAKNAAVKNQAELEELRLEYLGKKGIVTELFLQLKDLAAEEKKSFGAALNQTRGQITAVLEAKKQNFERELLNLKLSKERLDLSEPERKDRAGLLHPLSKAIKEAREIFTDLGFAFEDGPEVEDDFHNFSALNIPDHHPARQMQDTFYLKGDNSLLRTHTSNVQIRAMINSQPPFRIISVGRVFRRDDDQTHTPMFHQLEGFLVDQKTNMAELKWVIEKFLQRFFEVEEVKLRFRPSFFPFTEPSAEVDIGYCLENGAIKIGGGSEKFMEVLGCGMIHPNVLKNCGIDPSKYRGFAFGVGIERLAMLKYGISDLRMMFENDLRFLDYYGFRFFDF